MGNCCCIDDVEYVPLKQPPNIQNTSKKYTKHKFYPKTFLLFPPMTC